MGESGCLSLSSSLSAQPSDLQGNGSRLSPNAFNCSREAQHALVLGPGQNLSVQIPFQLPLQRDLVTQAFSGVVHRNLSNLNLHAWLLEPLPFRNKGSLTKWQQELRLLRDSQPEPCTSPSGPFLSNGATHTSWTSGCPL